MQVFTGACFVICGVVLLAMFHRYIVQPAFTPLPDGGFGEIYGPVAFFRPLVYGLCVALVAIGSIIVLVYRP